MFSYLPVCLETEKFRLWRCELLKFLVGKRTRRTAANGFFPEIGNHRPIMAVNISQERAKFVSLPTPNKVKALLRFRKFDILFGRVRLTKTKYVHIERR